MSNWKREVSDCVRGTSALIREMRKRRRLVPLEAPHDTAYFVQIVRLQSNLSDEKSTSRVSLEAPLTRRVEVQVDCYLDGSPRCLGTRGAERDWGSLLEFSFNIIRAIISVWQNLCR